MGRLAVAGAAVLAAGCATGVPEALRVGEASTRLESLMGAPTTRLTRPQGGTRWVYARGPMGRETWMVDVDAAGRVSAWHQALGLSQFAALPLGLSREELLLAIGPPAQRQPRGLRAGEVWSYRYTTNECLWYQVTLDDTPRTVEAGFGIDPHCDAGPNRD